MSTFTPSLKLLRCDARGRIAVGSVDSSAKGRTYGVSVNSAGQILLTPEEPALRAVEPASGDIGSASTERIAS